ncbi:hypothetical protein ACWDYJ_18890 [Streptomyces sp. NPDC003042]
MTDIVKYLPQAAIPAGGASVWEAEDARRWLGARAPAAFAPILGGWVLAPPVLLAVILLGWNGPEIPEVGTAWAGYPAAVLLLVLPAWYRFLPVATAVSVPVIALDAALGLYGSEPGDRAGRAGAWLVLGLCTLALTGVLLRLRARRRQRALFLAAAGAARHPVPKNLPRGHHRRGLRLNLTGTALCVAAAAFLFWGLERDLEAAGNGAPYDATGQQVVALLLLAPGTPLLGRGIAAWWAARRLHRGPQPVLRVGVRHDTLTDCDWLFADARITTAEPLVGFRDRFDDRSGPDGRILVGGPTKALREEHHDINERREPYEAIMYGLPCEGAEVIVEFAVYRSYTEIVSSVTAAPLLAVRRPGLRLREWSPARTSYALQREADEERDRERREEEAARRRESSGSSSCGSSGGCGSSSSCGSGCGGGGGCGGD